MPVTVAMPPPVAGPKGGTPPVRHSPAGHTLPLYFSRLYKFTVSQYHAMIRVGIIPEGPGLELLEGHVVLKMPQNPAHGGSVKMLDHLLQLALPAGWTVSVQSPISLDEGEPEPDLAVVRGDRRTYFSRHPWPRDFGVVVEVSDSSLAIDRSDKLRIYARAGLPEYWIVNIPDRQVEVYTDPQPAADPPGYASRADYRPGDVVPLTLDGATVAVPVSDLLP